MPAARRLKPLEARVAQSGHARMQAAVGGPAAAGGTVISTGSPAGNGSMHGVFLKPGDIMEGEITGLGRQRTPCVAEAA